jgi:hypothetical protein
MTAKKTLPEDATERKALPLQSGVLDYFPAALIEVAKVSKVGNDQHNPGKPLYWARGKSNDHADALQRHQLDHGGVDKDGLLHSAKVAWRALAQLQVELEAAGAPLARGAQGPTADRSVASCVMTCEEYWDARATLRNQGQLAVHAVGVCSLCDTMHISLPENYDIVVPYPPHFAKQ